MKYFLLLAHLLLCVFLIASAAADHEAVICMIDPTHYEAIYRIIRERDTPGELAAAFGDSWAYTWQFYDIFKQMIEHRRLQSLEVCLPQIAFPDAHKRDRFLTSLLRHAVNHGNQKAAEFLLAQTFEIDNARFVSLWVRFLWNLEETRKLIQRHPEHAAGLAPTSADFSRLRKDGDGLILIELARCCEEIQPGTLDPTALLHGLMDTTSLGDEGKALVAQELLDMGARVEQRHLDRSNGHDRTKHLLHLFHDSQTEDVKDPGMD